MFFVVGSRDMKNQKGIVLSAEIQFLEDVRLFVWRPRGVLGEAAIKKVLGSLEDLEAKLQEPFNRFADTLGATKKSPFQLRLVLVRVDSQTRTAFSHCHTSLGIL